MGSGQDADDDNDDHDDDICSGEFVHALMNFNRFAFLHAGLHIMLMTLRSVRIKRFVRLTLGSACMKFAIHFDTIAFVSARLPERAVLQKNGTLGRKILRNNGTLHRITPAC